MKHTKSNSEFGIPNSELNDGFTLLELMVAVTLIAVMAVGTWRAIDICVRVWLRGIEAIDDSQRERSTYDLVRKQIASAYPLFPSPTSSSSATGSTGTQNTTAVRSTSASSIPVFSGGETSLRFVTPNSLMSADSMGLVLATYEAEIDSNDNIALVQRESLYTGQGVNDGGFISSVPVFFNLKECLFEYYDAGDANNPGEWLTEWDTAARRRLPAAVRISMLFKDKKRGAPGRQMIIPMRAQTVYSQTQTRQTRVSGQPQQPKSKPGGGGGIAKPGGGGQGGQGGRGT